MNKKLVLISGESTTGKSACLRNITEPEKVLYINTESGKELPFPSKFKQVTVTDPLIIPGLFHQAEEAGNKCDMIIIDSVTYMMDMYESLHVLPASNTMKAWGEFAQFFKQLMQKTVAESSKHVAMTAHTLTVLNESSGQFKTSVPVKGSLKNQGIESYFSCVVSTKKVTIKELEPYRGQSKLLNITPEEEALGFKYVFQTSLTKETVNESIRSPMKMWTTAETYIDNDIQLVFDRLDEYYSS